ncbi:mRNA transport regulator MTR2 [Cyberlindnera fabianii]|uniref:mRNA transport regulator MTR2 n=1 Tax=Cyberlindnera fabianii TaxID=36022 RepID=A0A1V2L0U2_CYBFA|nr:mRNA transport regulator MTR2 [Cyberlindnera fabianii]
MVDPGMSYCTDFAPSPARMVLTNTVLTGTQLEKLIKDLFLSLDRAYTPSTPLDAYCASIFPQLKQTSPVILNGNPIGGKSAFQQHWLKFPLTQHSVTSLDYHVIPGTNTLIVNVSGKVRFDESGKTKLGETADVDVGIPAAPTGGLSVRNIWGSWLGFNANLILDESCLNVPNAENVNSLNWKVVYKPEDVAVVV